MSRTITEIFNQMALEKAAQSTLHGLLIDPSDNSSTLDNSQELLNNLTSQSRVANWRLLLWTMAFGIWVFEAVLSLFVIDVNKKIDEAIPGTKRWLQKIAFEFQFGYDLVWNGNKYVYPVIDTSARIIKRCAIEDNGGIVRVKVATGATPVPLASPQEDAFTAYMQQMKSAGTNLIVINYPADQLRFQIDIHYNPLIPLAIIKPLVEAAISEYLVSLSTVDSFNGEFVTAHLCDKLQLVNGVKMPVVNNVDYLPSGGAWTALTNRYQTVAGYIVVSPSYTPADNYVNGLPTIRYIPYV